MKIAGTAMIAALVTCMGAAPVGAAVVDSVAITDLDNDIITISGTPAETGVDEVVTLTFMPEGKSIDDGTLTYTAGDAHIEQFEVKDGEAFSHSFKFAGEGGMYRVFVKRGNEVYDQPFELVNKEVIYGILDDLGAQKIPKEDIFATLTEYQVNLGLELSGFTNQADIDILVNVVYDDAEIIKAERQAGLKKCVDKAGRLITLFAQMEETAVWNSAYKLLQENADILDVDFDDYQNLNSSGQKAVCEQFVGKKFTSAAEIKTLFDNAVANQLKEQDSGSNNGSSGGGGGGGSSYRGGGGGSTVDRYYNQELLETPSTLGPGEIVPDGPQFSDMDNAVWAQEAVTALAESGIINGVAEGIFDPNGILTREQAAKIVVLAFGLYDETAEASFTDVPADNWAYRYVASAQKAGVMLGVSDIDFGAGQAVTRQDLATILYRAAGSDLTTPSTDFADFNEVADYAKEAVSYMAGAGIINGIGDNLFAPAQAATRAQAAKMIYELMGGAEQ